MPPVPSRASKKEEIKRTSRNAPPLVRFWSLVEKTETCWLWKGHLNVRSGRGAIWVGKTAVSAPRFAYQHLIGPIPDGLYVCHRCDIPACVNPAHLFLGTQDDNMKDMVEKGRSNKPKGEMNGRAKLTDDDVRFIRKNYKFRSKEFGQKQLAERFGVCTLTIQEVLRFDKWAHVM